MFRRTLPDGSTRTCLDRLSNRLTKIVIVAKNKCTSISVNAKCKSRDYLRSCSGRKYSLKS